MGGILFQKMAMCSFPGVMWQPPEMQVARYRGDSLVDDGSGFASAWLDIGDLENGYDLAQATAANRPSIVASLLGGKPGARFDGVNDSLFRDSTPAIAQDLTLVAIGVSNVADQGELVCNESSGEGASIFCRSTGGTYIAYAGVTGCQGSTGPGTPHLFEAYFNSVSSVLRVDAVPDAAGNAGTRGLAGIRIGASPVGNFLDGDVAEIIV